MIEDRPISQDGDKLLKLLRQYSGENPYKSVSYDEISPEGWKKITNEIISGIIREYEEGASIRIKGLQPTADSVRSCVAPASGGG